MDEFSEMELVNMYSAYCINMRTYGKVPKSYDNWLNFMNLIKI